MDSLFSIIGFIYFATSVKDNYLPMETKKQGNKSFFGCTKHEILEEKVHYGKY